MNMKRVVCGMSGGVDSSVAAILLKKQGYDVIGVFMRNWDIKDETGSCTVDKDFEDANWACRQINIPFHEVNLVKEYWNEVFVELLNDYEIGITPNPDILCNKKIKFGHFFNFALKEFKADFISTGHYAQISKCAKTKTDVKLLQAVDKVKDQTFFLSQVPQKALQQWLFPNGLLLKQQVKNIAFNHGLDRIARKKESMGICFVGKRNFQDFIDEYLPQKPGKFIDIDKNQVVGYHKGIHHYTLGQRCRVSGASKPYYVAQKIVKTQDIFVAAGHDHPIFFSNTLSTGKPYWIHHEPESLSSFEKFPCKFRFQNTMPLEECIIQKDPNGGLIVKLNVPLRALTPGQYAVFYRNAECLGSARIHTVQPTQIEQEKKQCFETS